MVNDGKALVEPRSGRSTGSKRIVHIVAALSLLIAACTGTAEETTTTGDTSDTTSGPATTLGPDTTSPDTTAVDTMSDFTLLTTDAGGLESMYPHPLLVGGWTYRSVIWDALWDFGGEEYIPRLAESWVVSDDGLTIELNVRPGVTFHDGSPLTADIVKENIEFAADPDNAVQGSADFQRLSVEAPDDSTVILTLDEPVPQLFSLVSILPIMKLDSDLDTAPVGTGAFQVDDFTPRVEAVMSRYDNYWDPSTQPPISTYTVRVAPDDAQALLTLESGQADAFLQPPLSSTQQIQDNPDLEILAGPAAGNYQWVTNVLVPPLDNAQVRCALSYAFDRERFVEEATGGLSQPTNSLFPPTSPVYSPDQETWTYDLEQARAMLEEAGFGDGFELTMQVSRGISPELSEFAPIYQADLEAIGIDVTLQELDVAAYVDEFVGAQADGIIINTYLWANMDPALLFAAVPFRIGNNAANYDTEEYRNLEEAGRNETDFETRREIYDDLNALAQSSCHVSPVATRVFNIAHHNSVSGLSRAIHGDVLLRDVAISGS